MSYFVHVLFKPTHPGGDPQFLSLRCSTRESLAETFKDYMRRLSRDVLTVRTVADHDRVRQFTRFTKIKCDRKRVQK
jgi:hypothetical protein